MNIDTKRDARGGQPVRWGPGADESKRLGTGAVAASVYTDPARYALERDRLFRRTWHVAGRVEQIAAPGDFLVWERVGQSVVIARQESGELAAFHNVCRHRGARIVSESGHCETGRLRCPFHGFAYDLAGRLVGVPERETFDTAKLDGLRAFEVAVEVWGGWIWIHLDPNQAKPLADYLTGLVDELAWYDMGTWAYHGGSTYVAEANWKVVLEGFLEAWHTPTVHGRTVKGGFDVPRSTFSALDPHSMMVVPLAALDIDSAPKPVEHRQYADCQYLLFPNSFLNMFPDQGYLITVHPIDANRTFCQGYVVASKTPPKGLTAEAWEKSVKSSIGLMDRIMAEDLGIAAEIGATRESFAYRENIYSTLECRITAFHRQVDAYLAD